MKLLTRKIIRALPPFYSTKEVKLRNKIVICKFFTPDSNWCWFVFEGEPVDEADYGTKDDFKFFGMVHGLEHEMGYFLLSELEKARGPWGLLIERDEAVFKKPYRELVSSVEFESQEVLSSDKVEDMKMPDIFKQWMLDHYEHNEMADMCRYGVSGGFNGLIYYTETVALYNQYKDDIWNMLYEDTESYGLQSVSELIASFNGAKDVGSDEQYKNLLVWYAAERVANEITQGEYLDEVDED